MKRVIGFLNGAGRILTAILKWLSIALFVALTAIVTALVFYGAAGVWMVEGHFCVRDWIGKRIRNERARGAFRLLLELISLLFAGVLFSYSLSVVIRPGKSLPYSRFRRRSSTPACRPRR